MRYRESVLGTLLGKTCSHVSGSDNLLCHEHITTELPLCRNQLFPLSHLSFTLVRFSAVIFFFLGVGADVQGALGAFK
jgi:hypothetical protein